MKIVEHYDKKKIPSNKLGTMSTVSSVNVPLVCLFNGTLTADTENNPKYINKVVKPVMVIKSIRRFELVEKIHRIAGIDLKGYQIHLTFSWSIAQGVLQSSQYLMMTTDERYLNCTRV